jgi:Flp pilus assembly protein CpaB
VPYRLITLLPSRWPPLLFRGAVCGVVLVGGFAALRVAGDLEDAAIAYGPPRAVPVAMRALEAGELIGPGDVERRVLPADAVPRAAVARRWLDHAVIAPVLPGEVVVEARLAPHGLRGAAALVPPDGRAIAVPGGPGGRPPLRVGDRVDVLATVAYESAGTDTPPTFLVAAAALVVAVDDGDDIVTVAVPAADAPRVAHAVTTASVTLALRT